MNKRIRNRPRSARLPQQVAAFHSLETLEYKALLSGVTFSVAGTTLTVSGDNTDNNVVVQNNGVTVEVNDAGNIIDTGVSVGSLAFVRVFGRGGNDTLTLDVSLGSGIKGFIFGGIGSDTMTGGLGSDSLTGDAGADVMNGGNGTDSFFFDSLDTLDGGAGQDTASAVDPSNLGVTLVLNSVANNLERIRGANGPDTFDASAVIASTRVDLVGLGGDDTLIGGNGNDSIFGGDDSDSIIGGGGNDSIHPGSGTNILDGGIGSDVLNYEGALLTGVNVNLSSGFVSNNGNGGSDSVTGFEQVNGSNFADLLVGSTSGDSLKGNGGDDTLIGLGGGDDLNGGTGTDLADYSASAAGINVNLGDGANESGGDAAGDTLFAVENIIGSAFDDTIVGNFKENAISGGNGNDFIRGGAGNDTLNGGDGNDTLFGGLGTDSFDGGSGNDILNADSFDDQAAVFTGGAGTDQIKAETDTVAIDWIFTNSSLIEFVFGSSVGDTIDASAVTNLSLQISARGGNDFVTGGSLGDTINGGAGDDSIFGNLGADILRGDDGDDLLYGNNLANTDDNAQDRFFGGNNNDTAIGINLSNAVPSLRDTIDAAIEIDLRV